MHNIKNMNININKSVKSISKDFVYNILASLVLTGVMQLVTYPLLARYYSSEEYGVILTLMGISNTIMVSIGNSLNNVRLIMKTEYEEKQIIGDFNSLLVIFTIIGVLVQLGVSYFIFGINLENAFLCLLVLLGAFKSYYCVQFRLVLNFKKILIQNIFGAIGYLIGSFIVSRLNFWPLPFLLAEAFQIVYIFNNSHLHKENFQHTILFRKTLGKYLILIVTGLSTTLITYLDRLIIYPLLGGESVSTYTVASFFGKTLGIVMTPIAGVLLGYYAQDSFKMDRKKYWSINGFAFVGAVLFMIVSIILSPFITKLLYPTIYLKASQYIFVANLAATINVLCQLTQSAVLKYAPTWLQIVKEVIYGAVYMISGYLLLSSYGLLGFCLAAIIANTVKLLVLYALGNIYIKKNNGGSLK